MDRILSDCLLMQAEVESLSLEERRLDDQIRWVILLQAW